MENYKYVRTESGIIYVGDLVKDKDGDYCYPNSKDCIELQGKYVLKESNNIEDLFDEYVFLSNPKPCVAKIGNIKNFPELRQTYFGAIWTYRGLIYVARMNADGEWELI